MSFSSSVASSVSIPEKSAVIFVDQKLNDQVVRGVVVVSRVKDSELLISCGLAVMKICEIAKRDPATIASDSIISQPVERPLERFALGRRQPMLLGEIGEGHATRPASA